jgi:hypothetical protein
MHFTSVFGTVHWKNPLVQKFQDWWFSDFYSLLDIQSTQNEKVPFPFDSDSCYLCFGSVVGKCPPFRKSRGNCPDCKIAHGLDLFGLRTGEAGVVPEAVVVCN